MLCTKNAANLLDLLHVHVGLDFNFVEMVQFFGFRLESEAQLARGDTVATEFAHGSFGQIHFGHGYEQWVLLSITKCARRKCRIVLREMLEK